LENTRKIAEYKIQNSEYQNKKAVFLLDSGFWILDTALMKIGLAGYSGSGVTTLLALLSEDIDLVNKHGGPEVRAISVDDPRLDRLMELFQPKKLTPLQVDVPDSTPWSWSSGVLTPQRPNSAAPPVNSTRSWNH
jgi:hypothetical protein